MPDPSVPSRVSERSADRTPRLGRGPLWRVHRGRPGEARWPWWSRAGLACVAVVAADLYLSGLGHNGMANSYYAAAVKSASLSWKAFFFGALDPGSFITVDKTPAAFWLQGLSVRAFGFSTWSMLIPQAIAGVISVFVVYWLVRRWLGDAAALIAALALAVTPVAVAMFRMNNPDALLTLLLLLAAWLVVSAVESGSIWRLAGAGALVGLAFLTKMLEALIVLPAFALVFLVSGPSTIGRRLLKSGAALAALVVSGGWWVAVVDLWPSSSRPFIGGSTNNSVLDLIFSRSGGYISNAMPNPNFSGAAGWLRMFNEQLGGQISWLIPLGLLGLAAGLWAAGRAPRTDKARAAFLLWGGWSMLVLAVFSFARGVLHPYYTVILAPSLAALVGGGSVALWRLGRHHRWLSWILPAGIVGTCWWASSLLGRTPRYLPGLAPAILAAGIAAALGIGLVFAGLVRPARAARPLAAAAAALGLIAVLAGPFAYSVSTVARPLNGPLAAGGPLAAALAAAAPGGAGTPVAATLAAGGMPGGTGEDLSVDPALLSYLERNQGDARFLAAVEGTQAAVPLILSSGRAVIAMGGFSGADPAPTVQQLEQMVLTGQLHYVLLGGGFRATSAGPPLIGPPGAGPFGPPQPGVDGAIGSPPGAGPGGLFQIMEWVTDHGTIVLAEDYGGSGDAPYTGVI